MNTTRHIALPILLLASFAAITPLLGCTPVSEGDDIVDVGDLRDLEVVVSRDGDGGSYYPRRLSVVINLPWPNRECPVLDPAMTVTLNGKPPSGLSRGGVSPDPGFFGDTVCEGTASAGFRVPDEGGPLVVRIAQAGFEPAVIEFDAPAIEPLERIAPADGNLRRGEIATVRVPASFYTSRNLTPPPLHPLGTAVVGNNPEPFAQTYLVARGQDLADVQSDRVIGGVGVATEGLLAEVPSYTTLGPKSLYVAYTYWPHFEPTAIRRCDGFAACKGEARDNFGVLGPIDVTVVE